MSMQSAFQAIEHAAHRCNGCRRCERCVPRCEVLGDAGCTVGEIATAFEPLAEGFDLSNEQAREVCSLEIRTWALDNVQLVFAVQRCCMCSFCTQGCAAGVDARSLFVAVREILALAHVTTDQGFESTQVDRQWDIFSVYRAVYGIDYADLPHMGDAVACDADTLFFPGCPLVSYAPELTREIFTWLQSHGMRVVLSETCCGSPLKAAGFADRALAFKQSIAHAIADAGIRRVVCVCPGCMDELREPAVGMDGIEFVPLPQLLVDAGVRIDATRIRCAAGISLDNVDSLRVAVCDSCHDREGNFGIPLRELFDDSLLYELRYNGSDALCCGAAGAVSLVDPDICTRRAQRVLDEGFAVADLMVANCPTCSYTFAAQGRAGVVDATGMPYAHCNYLDVVFEASFDWDTIFSQLEGMWSGEYGPWVCQQLT